MKYVWLTIGWFFSVFFGLLTISMLLMDNWLHAFVLFLVVLLCLPPAVSYLRRRFRRDMHPLVHGALIIVLLFAFVRLLVGSEVTSIYTSPEIKARFVELYDQKMAEWPVPYDDVFVDTRYGKVHVIVSGPENAPPILLLHASGVASWSWKFNAADLSAQYRTYAIDLIGDVGKSEFTSLDNVLRDGKDQAELYAEITDTLGIPEAFVVGASDGGFVGTNYALHHPERVEKLALLGPMGYAGATQSVMRIMFAQMFPLKPIQESTFRWAFSDDPRMNEEFGEWFRLTMTGYIPARVPPFPISAEERQRLNVPVLFIFGERDNLVGDPEAARALVSDVPNARVEIVRTAHLMGAEQPAVVDSLILGFFGEIKD